MIIRLHVLIASANRRPFSPGLVGVAFDLVTVSVTIKTDIAFTGLADADYSMDANLVEPRKE